MLLVQLSDLHIDLKRPRPGQQDVSAERLSRVVRHICSLNPRPDAVVLTGDLAEHGDRDEYQLLKELLAPLQMPYFVVPGNHDHREHLRQAKLGAGTMPPEGPLVQDVDLGPVRLLLLDTHVPGAPGGKLGAAQLGWLDTQLRTAPSRSSLIAMHHPPFRTGISAADAMGLEDAEAFVECVGLHPHVERVLCGHLHRSIVRRLGNTVASICPSIAPQLALDLRTKGKLKLVDGPPAYQLHLWSEPLGLVSHLSYVP